MNGKILITSLMLVLAAAGACKKNETTVTTKYLEGSIGIKGPSYIEPGKTVTFRPDQNLVHPENGTLTYSWRVTPGMTSYQQSTEKDNSFTHTFRSDTLGTFTVTCLVTPSGNYYSTSAQQYVTLVRSGDDGSMPMTFDASKDTRWKPDRVEYITTRIGEATWMRNNLGEGFARRTHTTGTPGREIGVPYRNYDVLFDIFGCYYTWEEAIDACPDGWHLPTEAEWTAMAATAKERVGLPAPEPFKTWNGYGGEMMCYFTFNGEQMREYWPGVNVTDGTRLSVKMLGYCLGGKYFHFFGERAVFWTASECADNTDNAWARQFIYDDDDVVPVAGDKKSFCAQVRCVKD